MQQMVKLVPDEPTGHHNLAALYKLAGKNEDALREFEAAEKLDMNLAAPHFQLYNAYRQLGRTADAARELAAFQEAKKRQEGAPIAENMEANNYTEIYETIPASVAAAAKVTFADRVLERDVVGIASAGSDLFAWSARGVSVYRNGVRALRTGLEDLRDVVSIAGGDYDNDGQIDLCIITRAGVAIYRNQKGVYTKAAAVLPPGEYQRAVWMDYDHDYDLDLLLFGEKPVLMRNQGDAGFTDQTASFPFVAGKVVDATPFAIRAETPARDLVVAYQGSAGVLYEDKLNGKFVAVPIPALTAGATQITAEDLNHDGWFDLTVRYLDRKLLLENRNGALVSSAGVTDQPRRIAVDWNEAAIDVDGALHWYLNQSASRGKWLRVGITGIKNLKTGESATVEVKAGRFIRRRSIGERR